MSNSLNTLRGQLEAHDTPIAVLGLGYVGLPVAIEFAKKFRVIGFDINVQRVARLQDGDDATREVTAGELAAAVNLTLTAKPDCLHEAGVYIVTVPTPIDDARRPDLRHLQTASRTVGTHLMPGNVVIYESTVYPGCTEEDCVPILAAESGLGCAGISLTGENEQHRMFFAGYSPERINPGDAEHQLPDIKKVTSGSTPEAAEFVDWLYGTIITAGTHKAPSIRVAEAAKVIENTQRDVNIALVNELAMLFNRMEIDTGAVLEAAATKWNFLPFRPGLVGGHCIGVDPYYLTHKAQQIGFHPQMILSGRRTNDGMGQHVAGEVIKLMARRGVYRPGARVLILGLTFKENCPDLRNTRVVDVIAALEAYNLQIDIHDPWADPELARAEYGIELTETPEEGAYAATVLCVAHKEFHNLGNPGIRRWNVEDGVIYDLKGVLPDGLADGRL